MIKTHSNTFNHQSFAYDKFIDYAVSLSTLPHTIWLDSSDHHHKNGQFSFIVAFPYVVFDKADYHENFFDIIKQRPEFNLSFQGLDKDIPFAGGFVGYFSYDALVKQRFDIKIPENKSTHLPAFYGGLYDVVLYANHHKQQAGIVALPIHPTQTPQQRIDAVMKQASEKKVFNTSFKGFSLIEYDTQNQKATYEQAVSQAIDYIKQGDIFQANVTRKIQIPLADKASNALQLYLKLREINAAPFGVYVNGGENFKMLSASPERFLKIHNRKIICEPIKGTIKQSLDFKDDERQKEILQNCPKNRAENIMITDLLRNDITPYAKTGSIKVEKLCDLQTYKGLHHLVSVITADMKDDAHICDILQFALPGGSITGAPKKRVCEIIYELEQQQRSAYCGTLGYIGFNGNCDMNILIRTLEIDKENITFNAGCGITSLSKPHEEYDETLVKIFKIIQTLTE